MISKISPLIIGFAFAQALSPVSLPPLTTSVENKMLCFTNDDCVDSTYCCSTYSCTLPDKCLMGQKQTEDTCDYNFECYSRCCFGGICTHFLNCYVACTNNNNCDQVGGCCSEGFCTQTVVC